MTRRKSRTGGRSPNRSTEVAPGGDFSVQAWRLRSPDLFLPSKAQVNIPLWDETPIPHPRPVRTVRPVFRRNTTGVVKKARLVLPPENVFHAMAREDQARVTIADECLAREQRREVLFARRRAGYSGSAPGPYRPKSKVKC